MKIDEFEFQDRNGNEIEPTKNQLVVYIKSLHKQIAELKQQLAEKDEQLRVKIGSMKSNDFIKMCLQCGLMIDVKEKDNQDKILFAIEQLEKVKGLIANHTQELWTCENDDIDVVLYEEIDNQINELKGKVE